jgi:hypothetical protein
MSGAHRCAFEQLDRVSLQQPAGLLWLEGSLQCLYDGLYHSYRPLQA